MITEKIKPQTREEQFIHLYAVAFPTVAAFVRKMNGTFDDAKDIFQDALVIYYEKKVSGSFSPEFNEQYYVNGIARHLWYKKFKAHKKTMPLFAGFDVEPEVEPGVSESILRYVELAGKKCLALLKSFYYDKLSMKELADKFGFAGERSATAQKYKCLEKVRGAIKERSLTKDDFYE
jgi:DNA-directed RNA polymerase specialized sigma24 family protein